MRRLRTLSNFLHPGEWRLVQSSRDGMSGVGAPVVFIHESLDTSATAPFVEPKHAERWVVTRDEVVASIEPQHGTSIAAQIALPRASGRWVLLDTQRGQVVRSRPEGFSEQYFQLRDRFSAHVPSVAYRRLAGPAEIVEDLAGEGMLIRESETTIRNAVAQVYAGLSRLASSDGGGRGSDVDGSQWLAQTTGLSTSDPRLRSRWGDANRWLGRAPIVPSHGDVGLTNIMVADGVPACIDFDRMALRPAWFDVAQLTFRTFRARPDLLADVDGEVEGCLSDAIPGHLPSDWRELLVVAGLAVGMVKAFEFEDLLRRASERSVPAIGRSIGG